MTHVNWHEADAYCRWVGRRLPTEAEWELAASAAGGGFGFAGSKRRFPWGDGPPGDDQANLDGLAGGCIDVSCCPAGDSAAGARQMIGNVWEGTASDFQPYPSFAADPYPDYCRPRFGTHKALRVRGWQARTR